jgi:5-methylcytosine-specific restriction endonuclease McrA
MDLVERLLPDQSYIKTNIRKKQIKNVMDNFDLSIENKRSFFSSNDWRLLKNYIYAKYENICVCCGADKELQIDHIKPITKAPSLALHHHNLQILCKTCNQIKSNKSNARFKKIKKKGKVNFKSLIGLRYKWMEYFPPKNRLN